MSMTVEPRSKSISLPSKLSLQEEDQCQNDKLNINEIAEKDKKPSLMSKTETTTLQKANNTSSIEIKRELFYSQNLGHKPNQSNSSIENTLEFDKSMVNMSQLGVGKDADVVVNISQLDLDRSIIKDYRNNTDSDMLDSAKRLGSEMSFDKGNDNESANEETKEKNKDKVDLLKTKEGSNKNKSIRKWIVLFIGIMIIVSALVFCLNKYLM